MDVIDLLVELFDRLPDLVRAAVDGLSREQLQWAPGTGANPIAWLIWHLTRVQDHHIAELLKADQIWAGGTWAAAFGLTPDPGNTGYGHTSDDVGAVRPGGPAALVDYFEAVSVRTREFVLQLGAHDLERVVDTRWDPPVTLGVRLVSVLDDDLEHVGQAAYVRGLLPAG